MGWFNKLERKYGNYAINNLMYYIIILYAIGFILEIFAPGVYRTYFELDFSKILSGEVWRLVTFILHSPSNSIIFVFFALYFYYMIGTVLENIWGAFKFNVYFFSGLLLNIIASLLIYLIWKVDFPLNTTYINLALFMAFAIEQPDMEVLLFFVLPIKIKWLGILDGAIFGITIITGYFWKFIPMQILQGLYNVGLFNPLSREVGATAALVSMLNFIMFIFIYKKGRTNVFKNQAQRNYNKAMKTAKKAQENKKQSFNERFYNANSEKSTWEQANQGYTAPEEPQKGEFKIHLRGNSIHKCAVCGRTEADGDDLTFRYCSKCAGGKEYCQDHLYTHIHINE